MTHLMLPMFLNGPTRAVKSAAQKAATSIAKGASAADVVDTLVDAAQLPGLIIVQETTQWSEAAVPHFHGYRLISALARSFGSFDDTRWDRVFDEMLQRPWLMCCCLGQDSYFLLKSPERARRFVIAVDDQWETLNSAGKKFRSDRPDWLWRAQCTVSYALGRIGATNAELRHHPLDPAYDNALRPAVLERYVRASN